MNITENNYEVNWIADPIHFEILLKTVPLEKAINVSRNKKYYYFSGNNVNFHHFILILNNEKERVGGILFCVHDLLLYCFPQFEGKHYISNCLRSYFFLNTCYGKYNSNISIALSDIKSIDDFNKKLHLCVDVLDFFVTNLMEAVYEVYDRYDKYEFKYNSIKGLPFYFDEHLTDYYGELYAKHKTKNNLNSYSKVLQFIEQYYENRIKML